MILLTGASGFIGKHLLLGLINKYGAENVIVLTSNPVNECRYILHKNYTFDANVFLNEGIANEITVLIHAGAFTPKSARQANEVKECNRNIYNTEVLLTTFLPNLEKILYLSTLDVYKESDIITEQSATEPISLYGESKLYCEKLIKYWAEANKIQFQILRIGHTYGPGEEAYQKLIPQVMKKILADEPVEIWGDGEDLRAFIFIEDVVSSILNAIALKEYVGPINLVSGNSMSIREVTEKIIEVSGKNVKIKFIPKIGNRKDYIFDNSKMKKYLLVEEEYLFVDGLSSEWNSLSRIY